MIRKAKLCLLLASAELEPHEHFYCSVLAVVAKHSFELGVQRSQKAWSGWSCANSSSFASAIPGDLLLAAATFLLHLVTQIMENHGTY